MKSHGLNTEYLVDDGQHIKLGAMITQLLILMDRQGLQRTSTMSHNNMDVIQDYLHTEAGSFLFLKQIDQLDQFLYDFYTCWTFGYYFFFIIYAFCTHCNSLEIVGLRGCHNLTDAGIAAIISNNSQLGVIIISYCFRATNESINAVVSGCPRIDEIVAIGVGFISLPEDMFDNLPRLVYLNLSKNKISRLPKSIIRMSNECHIFLSGNPLKYPPLETVEQGMGAITSYFNHHRQLGVQQERTQFN